MKTLRDLIEQAPLDEFVSLKFLNRNWESFKVEKTTRFYEPQETVYCWCICCGLATWVHPMAGSNMVAFYKTEAGARRSLIRFFTRMGVSLDTVVPDSNQ